MSGIAFESIKTNLITLFSRVFLANWFSPMFCIFIGSFPDIHLFLINRNLFRFRNRLWIFSTHFCSFTNRFCSFLLVYQWFQILSTRLPFTSRLYSFVSRSTHFCLFTQGSTSFTKLGLKSRFHQLESSLASFSITTFQIKPRKLKQLKQYIFPKWNYSMPSEKFFWE